MRDRTDGVPNDADWLDRLINEQEAASFLGFSVRALQNWRVRGGGPEYVRVSRRSVRYRRRDLVRWSEERLEPHTSAASLLRQHAQEADGTGEDAPQEPAAAEQEPAAEAASSPGEHLGPELRQAKPRRLRTLLPHDRD
jgi:predicted DNA-binding transcriptional regulator AlpA